MNLEKHFSPKRFVNYLKYDLFLNGKIYLFFGVGLCLAIFLISLFFISIHSSYNNFDRGNYIPYFFLIFTLTGCLAIGNSFASLRKSRQKKHFLTLPVSILEKYLAEFLLKITTILTLFTPLYWLVFKLANKFYNLFEWKRPVTVDSFSILEPFLDLKIPLDQTASVLSIFSMASFLFSGASYFKKFAFVKTILSFGLLIAFIFLNIVLYSHIFYENPRNEVLFIKIDDYRIDKDLNNFQMMMYILGMTSSLFLIPVAYFNLKEKQA